jgi:hypothetical protein
MKPVEIQWEITAILNIILGRTVSTSHIMIVWGYVEITILLDVYTSHLRSSERIATFPLRY